MNGISWLTAFIDRPATSFDEATAFWLAVTGSALSTPRGEHDEFATLVPPDGGARIKVQRIESGPAQLHLDLHVEDVFDVADRAVELGATITVRHDTYVVLASPGGLPWCAVGHAAGSRPPPPTVLPDGTRVAVAQVCVDIAPERYDAERAFWTGLTGWTPRQGQRPEYAGFEMPEHLPLRLLLQRLDEPHDERDVDAHLDVFTSNPSAAAEHQVLLGARIVEERPFWIVMADPSDEPYCLINRDP